ncbi:SdiA-regulated domain-containing protein [Pontibaca methylaminivorans]|uniref:SdiA-regulated domain-containing protein n=1 Tax=Pontibaca methylaminivorans TaxID=515897 RepID=UPI002FD8F1F8
MSRAISRKSVALAVAALTGLCLAAVVWLPVQTDGQAPGIDPNTLDGHTVLVERRPIEGLSNVSGLAYSGNTNTLFAVINRPAAIAELSLDGRLLRHFPLPEGWDTEGITHLQDDLFIVSDERGNDLHWIRIPPGDGGAVHEQTTSLSLGWIALPNLGLEGVIWDPVTSELLLVNEKWPRKILQVSGLWPPQETPQVGIREWWPERASGLPASDLAGLTLNHNDDGSAGNLIVLSEESKVALEYTPAGVLAGVLPLESGSSGLTQDIPQPEGIAIGPNDDLFIVSEPNLFYRFAARTD